VPDGETLAAAKMLCASILKGSSAAVGVTKRLLSGSDTTGLEQQLRAESENLAALSATEDAYERCRRFIK
jgi:enoyl-CoA hydratase/carnithine racemase